MYWKSTNVFSSHGALHQHPIRAIKTEAKSKFQTRSCEVEVVQVAIKMFLEVRLKYDNLLFHIWTNVLPFYLALPIHISNQLLLANIPDTVSKRQAINAVVNAAVDACVRIPLSLSLQGSSLINQIGRLLSIRLRRLYLQVEVQDPSLASPIFFKRFGSTLKIKGFSLNHMIIRYIGSLTIW